MKYTTIAVIYNPNSTGSGETLAREFKKKVQQRIPGQKIALIETEHPGHGEELAYKIASESEHPLIISSSGDGGYNDVVNGAMRAQNEGAHPTTGLLPAGNANDHYHNLHNEDIVEQIATGQLTKIDILKVSGLSDGKKVEKYAHSYIGFGLTPIVGNELNKTKLNPINEVFIVAKSLFTIKPVRLKIGKKVRSYESIIFSNVDVMSKYLKISQPSSITDGKFEVTIFRRRNKIKLILLLLEASLKGVKEDAKVSEFKVTTVQKTLVQADGEIITFDAHSGVHITIEPRSLASII